MGSGSQQREISGRCDEKAADGGFVTVRKDGAEERAGCVFEYPRLNGRHEDRKQMGGVLPGG